MPAYIEINQPDVRLLKEYFDPKRLVLASYRSIKTAGSRAATQASRAVREVYTVKAALVAQALKINFEASDLNQQAELELLYRGTRIGLDKFGAKPKRITLKGRKSRRFGRKRVGVTVKIRKDKPRQLVKGGFLATMNSGKALVYQRVDFRRLPIQRLKTLSIAEMIRIRRVEDRVSSTVKEVYPRELTRLLDLELNRVRF